MKVIRLIFSYKLLLPIGIIILLVYIFQHNNNYIRIRGLFKEYLNIFDGSKLQVLFFFGVPSIFALAFVQMGEFTENSFSTIYVVDTILITMFFSVLTVLLEKEKNENEVYLVVLHQTISIILFEIVMCMYTVLYAFIYQIIRGVFKCDFKYNFKFWIILYIIFYGFKYVYCYKKV